MTNYIYIGIRPPQEIQDSVYQLGGIPDNAGFTLQSAILKGLDSLIPSFKLITTVFIHTYPRTKKIYFSRLNFSHKNSHIKDDVFISFVNLPILNRITRFISFRSELIRQLKKDEENIVITYALTTPQLLAIVSLQKHISKICLVVPDLPEYMSSNKGIRKLGKYLDGKLMNFCLKRIGYFALLSPHMKEKLPIKNQKWIVMEGIYDNSISIPEIQKEKLKTILYTGCIGTGYGIEDMLEAFSQIESPDYRLWIRGNGSLKSRVLEMSKRDSRVIYFDQMSKEELHTLQRKATVLVNPIPPSREMTKYFFPSKTMEYLASGTPCVMYKLGCIPSEYDKYLFYVKKRSIEGLKDKLVEVCEMQQDILFEKGRAAKEFILKEKNPTEQVRKILNLLEND